MVGGRSEQPDSLQRSGLLSVSAARQKGRTASRSCLEQVALYSDLIPSPLVDFPRKAVLSFPIEVTPQPPFEIEVGIGSQDIGETADDTEEKVTDEAEPVRWDFALV